MKRKPRPKVPLKELLVVRKFSCVDRRQLKYMLTEFYHRSPEYLASLDRFTPPDNCDRGIQYKADHIPGTGNNLVDVLGWSDLRECVNCLSDWHDACLRTWVSAKAEWREDWPEIVTEEQMAEAIIELLRKIEVYL